MKHAVNGSATCLCARLLGRGQATRRQEGFTLVELIVALAVMGIMASGFLTMNSMMRSSAVNTVIRQVGSIREATDNYTNSAGAVNYSWTSPWRSGIPRLKNARYLPSSIDQCTGSLCPDYVTWYGGPGNTQLVIYIGNLPSWAQSTVVNNLNRFGSAGASGYWTWVVF